MMAIATDQVVLQPMASGSGAGTSSMAVAKKKAAQKRREEGMPAPLFVPPQDKWGKMYYPPLYHLSPDAF